MAWSLLLGGRNRELADHVGAWLRARLPAYDVVSDLDRIPRTLAGQHDDNQVNRPRHCGVQIELPPLVRWDWAGWGWSPSPPGSWRAIYSPPESGATCPVGWMILWPAASCSGQAPGRARWCC